MILISVIFTWVNNRFTTVEIDENIENIENMDANEQTDQETEKETVFKVNSQPAIFRFFVENENGEAFTNNLLIEQYITRRNILETASNETNTKLKKLVEETGNKVIIDYSESEESKIIGVARDGSSHLLEFHVNVGNETDNLKIADYYFAYLAEDNIPFLSNKNIYVFHRPRIKDLSDETAFESASEEETGTTHIVQDIIIGLVLGGVVSIGLLLLPTFMSKKLRYSFSYTLAEDDYFLLIDEKLDYHDELKHILSMPEESSRVILTEDKSREEYHNEDLNSMLSKLSEDMNFKQYNAILDIVNPNEVDRIIYIVQENTTTRDWYNKQRSLERTYEIPSVVIQVNKN